MDYRIMDDLLLIREFYGLSQDELARKLGIDKITISRIENNVNYPRIELMDKIYCFCFDNGLKMNVQKEMLYRDDIENGHILLTHASKNGIDGNINFSKSRVNNDFGIGFYCGEFYEKSISFISKTAFGSVYFLDFNPTDLKSITFEVSTEWMLAIAFYRGRLDDYKNSKVIKEIINKIKEADYIIAPIADNRMFQIIDSFIDGIITDEQCKHCLAATNLGMQYVFISDKSLEHLNIIERCFVSSKEKEYYQDEQIKFQKDGYDKSKLAMIKYRGIGKYIEELL